MKLKKPLFGCYVDENDYRKLYSRVENAILSGKFKDGYNEVIKSTSCSLAGVYKNASYETIFNRVKSIVESNGIFKLKSADYSKGKIVARRGLNLRSFGDRIFANIYSIENGYWIEIRAEPIFQMFEWGIENENVNLILRELLSISIERFSEVPVELGTLDNRIEEVLSSGR